MSVHSTKVDGITAAIARELRLKLQGKGVLYVFTSLSSRMWPIAIEEALQSIENKFAAGGSMNPELVTRRLQAAADALEGRPSDAWRLNDKSAAGPLLPTAPLPTTHTRSKDHRGI